ncbi:tripartite tricarboxylate transporter permease [Alkalihalobacillus sp. AL-G]|uniref:tripartite tricarboxylate transporter permease n=1 Tax=Alkalihalobacillus sp. AL-G TaxID=2926399 RepID=UPI00272B5E93|nr:tripartite tricarboxylate transporter permease [Alkalihalobacillus sp. AL-G]WLD93714.1 tripartite tricarboxylate transporter permease [Alkalihalobacillus sp. AL-G]
MEIFEILTPLSVVLVFTGVLMGIIFGAIPGMTATMAIALFLPLTYALDMVEALALLLGLYVGGISGGLVPAILLNIPGTPSSLCTTFDGFPMTQKGQGEKALKIGITASLIGGFFSLTILYFFAPLLASVAIEFSSVEKFLIILFALTVIASISKGSLLVGIFSGVLGIYLSLIGMFPDNNKLRLVPSGLEEQLYYGFALLPVLIGLFAIAQIMQESEEGMKPAAHQKFDFKKNKKNKFTFKVFNGQIVNTIRSSLLGTFIGILPGVGGSAASITAYSQAKNFSKKPEKLGTGEPEGVIASEASNNGLTGGALIPLLSLGIPGDSTTAVLIGAFLLQGIQVGPLFITTHPELWGGIVYALIIANIAMFLLMFFFIKYMAKIIYVPKHTIYPIIIVMCVVGSYAINDGVMFDVWTLLLFGVLGYIFIKIGIQIAPFLIGFILGKPGEKYFIDSLKGSDGDLTIFFTKGPIAVVLWLMIIASIVYSIYSNNKSKKDKQEETITTAT